MLCALLGLLHTYSAFGTTFRIWGADKTSVGVSVESAGHRMTIMHNETYLSCFTNSTNQTWLSPTLAHFVTPAADHYLLYPRPHPEADLECDDDDDDDDEEDKEENDDDKEENDKEEKELDTEKEKEPIDIPRAPSGVRTRTSIPAVRAPSPRAPSVRTLPPSRPPPLRAIVKRVKALRVRAHRIQARLSNVTNRLHRAKNPRELLVLLKKLHHLIKEKAQTRQRLIQATIGRFTARQRSFATSEEGKEALAFCKSVGAKGHSLIGCMQDMRITDNPAIAKVAVVVTKAATKAALKASSKSQAVKTPVVSKLIPREETKGQTSKKVFPISKVSSPAKVSQKVSSPAKVSQKISSPAKVSQKVSQKVAVRNAPSRTCSASGDPHFSNFNGEYFHIQENAIYTLAKSDDGLFEVQVKQSGSTGAGSPSYVRGVVTKYADQTFRSSFRRDGFSVQVGPSFVSVTVPGTYENRMLGICGADRPSAGPHNFKLPSGALADVNYGKKNWALGGYGGPMTKLSQWHLSWRPPVASCLFPPAECLANLRPRSPSTKRFISTPWGVIDTKL